MKLNYVGAAVIGVAGLLCSCGRHHDHAPVQNSWVVNSTTNVRRAIDDMIDAQATAVDPIEIVVGLPGDFAEKIAETYSASFMQVRLNDELQRKYGSYKPVVRKFDFEVTDTFGKDRIFIGVESTNIDLETVRSSSDDQQYRAIQANTGRVEGYDFFGKKLIVVTGDQPVNVMAAGFALSEYDHTLNNGSTANVNGSIVSVGGVYPDVTTQVEKQ